LLSKYTSSTTIFSFKITQAILGSLHEHANNNRFIFVVDTEFLKIPKIQLRSLFYFFLLNQTKLFIDFKIDHFEIVGKELSINISSVKYII